LHDFARVPHAFALVGLGLADPADVGGDLADSLLVDAFTTMRSGVGTSNETPSGASMKTGG